MKKLFLFFILFLFAGISFAQDIDFRIQPDGSFLNYKDNKDYVVIEYPDKTKNELYTNILTSVTKLYNSPKDVISKVENEVISINGISSDCVMLSGWLGVKVYFSIQYGIKFMFKDGRMRVDAPIIIRLYNDSDSDIKPISGWLSVQGIFKKGEPNPKKQNTIDDFNNTLNNIILDIINDRNNPSNDEW